MSWLKLHNPHIDWPIKRVDFNSAYCIKNCVPASNVVFGNIGGHIDSFDTDLGGVEVFKPLEGIQRDPGGVVASKPLEGIPVEFRDYADVFADDDVVTELPPHRPYDLEIVLQDPQKPVKGPVYPLRPSDDEELRRILKEQLDKGLIRPSKSRYCSPVIFVPKKNGKRRMCVDYRALNENTVKNSYPIPLISTLVEKLRGAKIFTTLDLKWGYNLVRIKEGDEWKTAFKTKYGLFEYLVMPFGLCNAPAAFQNFMNEIFRDILDVYVIVYLDDILIFSKDPEDHAKHVAEVLRRLRFHQLYCNLSKCVFKAPEVEYLGVIANGEGVRANPAKITEAVNWATPKTVKGVQEFLGFVNYYRKFIEDFAGRAYPLYQLLRKESPWRWGQNEESSFNILKRALVESPILIQPDVTKEFTLECDASDYATGAILNQLGKDGKLHPVAFYSKTLSPAERNYDIHDKELLAMIRAFKEWRHLLEGSEIPIKVLSDHKNLEFFQTKRDLNRRQARWMGFLADYNYRIKYRSGAQNGKADILSRREDLREQALKEGGEIPPLISPELFISAILTDHSLNDMIRDALPDDKSVSKILKSLEENIPVKGWRLENDLLYYHDRIYVPNELEIRRVVIESRHDNPAAGHPGHFRTLDLVSRDYYWSGMKKSIVKYVQACDSCIRNKHSNQAPPGLLQPIELPNKPWEEITYDLIVGLPMSEGYDAILTVVDRLSKMVHFIPTHSNATAVDVANLFVNFVWKLHRLPRKTISDRGPNFNAKFLRQVYSRLGIEPHYSTAYRPQVDGQSERLNQFIEIYLRHYINHRQTDWVAALPLGEFAYNNGKHAGSKHTPFFACYGYNPDFTVGNTKESSVPQADEYADHLKSIHEEAKAALTIANRTYSEYYNRKHREATKIEVGSKVFLDGSNIKTIRPSKKLDNRRFGPYKVVEQIGKYTFKLDLPKSMKVYPVFHTALLYPKPVDDYQRDPVPVPTVVTPEGEEEYEVERILDSRKVGRRLEYYVSWKGYGAEENSWEPKTHLKNAPEKIADFHRDHPDAPGP
ncbi:Transposon Tf2-7 polyprotein [Ceratobasidium sp. AG-Ba]|nr:Transposon Tf2-7 polyprotein [Ceratobasidium sp. AG-Ba]